MKCSLCGKKIREGELHTPVPGHKGEYCARCFESLTGIDYKTAQARRRKIMLAEIIGLFVLLGAYLLVANTYVAMVLYLAFSFTLCSFLNYFDNYPGNDFVITAAIILLPFFCNLFSIAYKLFLFGVLIQGQLPIATRDTAPHSAFGVRVCHYVR